MSSALRIVLAVIALRSVGCAPVVRVANIEEVPCQRSLSSAMSSILVDRGESREAADRLADAATRDFAAKAGRESLVVTSPSDSVYTFVVDRKNSVCTLELFRQVRGRYSRSNNETYVDSRPIPRCSCAG